LRSRKLIFIVLDGVGIGELPDAGAYGDQGTNTLGNVARAVGGLSLPNLERLGLARVAQVPGLDPRAPVEGCFGRMAEQSAGKDSTTGHWEIAGVITEKPFPLYPQGFPKEIIDRFVTATGCLGVLGNKAASGTDIIRDYGDEHVRTKFPIVYTSGDSVFQVAAHEDVIPLPDLYRICLATREQVMVGRDAVGRVIARPFTGKSGAYVRTANRRDYSLPPPSSTLLDCLAENAIDTVSIGKIDDLFSGRGLKEKIHTKSNAEGIEQIFRAQKKSSTAFVMANLVDFDMAYGHRQDPKGFAAALKEFDAALPGIIGGLADHDLLMVTADHGNDPTDDSTDHSREYVPLLCYSKSGKREVDLGVRDTFADAGKTVGEYFGVRNSLAGVSFLSMVV